MRPLIAGLVNLLLALGLVLRWPFRRLRPRPEWVRLRLRGALPYREMPRPGLRQRLMRRPPAASDVTSLHALERLLVRLGHDARVTGIILQLEELSLTAAKRAAIREMLSAFRARKKRVIGWVVSAASPEVELLASADEILVSPAGRIELTGFAAELTAIGEGLEKLGVRAEFIRRGDFKTAPELFTRRDISPIQRETTDGLLADRYRELCRTLAIGRGRTEEEIRQRIDEGPYSARRALEVGLVDGLCSEADLPERLAPPDAKPAKDGAPARARVASVSGYLASLPWAPVRFRPMRRRPTLALLPVQGAIMPGVGGLSPMGRAVGADPVVRALKNLEKAPGVDAVLLQIESPGGSALASELILEAARRLDRKKPVLAYVDGVCASGGYMVAMGAREFWAAPTAIVGSIGVFAGKFDLSGLLGRLGVHREVLTHGQNAGLFATSRGFTPSERAAMDQEVEETYQAFLGIVAQGRKRTVEEIHALGEGRIFSGRAALEAGLVDRNGGFEAACRRALELAGKGAADFDVSLVSPTARGVSLRRLVPALESTRLWAWSGPQIQFLDERPERLESVLLDRLQAAGTLAGLLAER